MPYIPSVGPCATVDISAINMNLVGVLILNQDGNNIFNNEFITSKLSDITGVYDSYFLSASADPSITLPNAQSYNISDLFSQTYDIKLNNLSCDFDSNNDYDLYCRSLNPNLPSQHFNFDPLKMFSPQNTEKFQTYLSIFIPEHKKSSYISKIVLILNNQLDNSDMLNSLIVEINDYDYVDALARWDNINTNIDPNTNFITLSIPSSTSVSNFKNIKKNNRSKFVDIPASYVNSAQATRIAESVAAEAATAAPPPIVETVIPNTYSGTTSTNSNPTTTYSGTTSTNSNPTTTYSGTTSTNSNPTTTYSGTTSTNANPTTTYSGSMTTIPLTTYGYKINKPDLFSSPETKLYQHNFEGTSNIYSPAIYYNVEKFTPLNF
jgi:hypothetical protein